MILNISQIDIELTKNIEKQFLIICFLWGKKEKRKGFVLVVTKGKIKNGFFVRNAEKNTEKNMWGKNDR